MKPGSIIQEILLVTTTSFSKRQLCETDSKENNYKKAPAEQLEAACWNGLLDEMLPEIMQQSTSLKKLFLWQAEMRNFLLYITKAECPPSLDNSLSLDPCVFLSRLQMN